jgi:hypothetical protein
MRGCYGDAAINAGGGGGVRDACVRVRVCCLREGQEGNGDFNFSPTSVRAQIAHP